MKHLDLFSGIGGFALAARWTGKIDTVGFCEIDPFCQKVLAKNFPGVPIHDDVRTFDGSVHRGRIDILTGGFPCQPFSCAGQRRGRDDDRHLWPAMFHVIEQVRPRWIVGENVPGLINVALTECVSDLESAGYEVGTLVIPACAVDAPHRRDRLWLVAHLSSAGLEGAAGQIIPRHPDRPAGSSIMADDASVGRSLRETESQHQESQRSVRGCDLNNNMADSNCSRKLQSQRGQSEERGWPSDGGWWLTEPGVDRVAYGIPDGVDRLKSLGNAIVPQVAYPIMKAIVNLATAQA